MSKRKHEEDAKLIEEYKKMLSVSKLGKELVEFADKTGVKILFDDHQNSLGYFNPSKNIVAIRSDINEDMIVGTLAHEIRHAWQFTQGLSVTTEYSPRDMVLMSALLEADAEACHAQVAWELKEAGNPGVMEESLGGAYAIVQDSFNDIMVNGSKNVEEAKRNAFDAWFKNEKMRNRYVYDIINFAFLATLELASQAKKGFKQITKDLIRPLGKPVTYGKNYLKNVNLTSDKYSKKGIVKRLAMMILVFEAGLKRIAAPKNMKPKVLSPTLDHK